MKDFSLEVMGLKKKSFLIFEQRLFILFFKVKQYTMNPKAMPRQQLLGHIDMDTREWADGVLTSSARNVVREPQGKESNISQHNWGGFHTDAL